MKYKQIKPLPKTFKIKVNNPSKGKAVQKAVFAMGKYWVSNRREVDHINELYLYLYLSDGLSYGSTESFFKENELPKIKFKDYFKKERQRGITIIIAKDEIPDATNVVFQNTASPNEKAKDESKYFNLSGVTQQTKLKDLPFYIDERWIGEYKDISFCLDKELNWEIKTDEHGVQCLIPTKKN